MNMKRREVLKLGMIGTGALFAPNLVKASTQLPLKLGSYPHKLPPLGFQTGGLGSLMSSLTLEQHYGVLHQGYVNNLNRLLETQSELQKLDLVELVQQVGNLPEAIRANVRWFAGGHLNHSLFWRWIVPGGSIISPRLQNLLGDVKGIREEFVTKGISIRGSGWVWLVVDAGKLVVTATAQQDNPWMSGLKPVLGCDVFEHSYYLDYQANRRKYLETFWDAMVNWKAVESSLEW
jgi:superoxide dismutase, Fe-Mn family